MSGPLFPIWYAFLILIGRLVSNLIKVSVVVFFIGIIVILVLFLLKWLGGFHDL